MGRKSTKSQKSKAKVKKEPKGGDEETSRAKGINVREMSVEERREYDKLSKKKYRGNLNRKPQTPVKDMTDEEKRTYERERKKTYRDSQKNLTPTKRVQDRDDDDISCNVTPRKKGKKLNNDSKAEILPETFKNCKIRFAFIDILDSESDAIVLPVSKKENSFAYQNLLRKQLSKQFTPQQIESFETDICSSEWITKLDNCEVMNSTCDGPTEDLKHHSTLHDKSFFHVMEPSFSDPCSKFSMATESQLRAAYLSCLIKCDKLQLQSVSFPLLGNGVCKKMSIAIGIQMVYSYMQAVEDSYIQLVYFVTEDSEQYDEIGKFIFYIRELDLTKWRRELFFEFERLLFNQLQPDELFVSVPGTDMIMRAFKLTMVGKAKTYLDESKNIHNSMLNVSGIQSAPFVYYKSNASRGRMLPSQFVKNSHDGPVRLHNFLNINFPLRNYCGSNAYLRTLWVLSRYYMYGWNEIADIYDLCSDSEAFKKRNYKFHCLKRFHKHIRKLWIQIETNAPHVCDCKIRDGTHENLMVFSSKMSHFDSIFEKWTVFKRDLIYTEDSVEILKKMPDFIYGSSKMDALSEQKTNKIIITSSCDWHNERKVVCEARNELLKTVINETYFDEEFATLNELNPELYDALSLDYSIESGEHDEKWSEHLAMLTEAKNKLETALAEEDKADAASKVVELEGWIKYEQFKHHTEEDLKIEKMMRNRLFRRLSHTWIENSDETWDMTDENGNNFLLTVDQFITLSIPTIGTQSNNSQSISDDMTYMDSDETPQSLREYPGPVSIGKRNVECAYCHALSFETERLPKCCKNGSVWIPPFPKIPKELRTVFEQKFRRYQISANAAFSMASISYSRIKQAPGGVQSMKINGLMSFHPSAVHLCMSITVCFQLFLSFSKSLM